MNLRRSILRLWARWRGPVEFFRGLQSFGSAALLVVFWSGYRGYIDLPGLWSEVATGVMQAFDGRAWLLAACVLISVRLGIRRWRKCAAAGVRT